jgi:peptidyl-prolyl cis-trans isomerase C
MSVVSRLCPLAVVALLALPAACNDKALQTASTPGDAGKHLGGSISPEQAAKVLAKVGDHAITLGDFVAALEHMDQFDRLRYQSPERRKELLREMINVQLLADEAVAKGYDKEPGTQQEVRSILRSAMMEQAHSGAPMPNAISESEVQAYFEAHKDQYRDPERRKISVILLPDDANAAGVLDAAKKAPNSAKWGELVRTKSIDPGAKANAPIDLAGDYGWVAAPGEPNSENAKAPEEVRIAAFKIPAKGQVYDSLVKLPNDTRAYIIRLTELTPAHERTLAEADRSIRVKIVQDKVREREEDLLNRLRSEYPVQIDDAVLSTVHVDLPYAPHQVFADASTGAAMMGDAGATPVPPSAGNSVPVPAPGSAPAPMQRRPHGPTH